MNNRITICLTASRSYAKLAKAVKDMNENIYGNEIFADDRVEFHDAYDADGNLTHFEITGTALDMFQIGLRYGHMEERDHLSPYVKETYRDIFCPTPETIA
jgi:hypothetical protein